MKRKIIFVCSPYRADTKEEVEVNKERARKACRLLSTVGYLPFAPHLYFTQFLHDEDEMERDCGIQMGMELLKAADEIWCFGDCVSEGMAFELAAAKEIGIPIRMMPDPEELVEAMIKEMD